MIVGILGQGYVGFSLAMSAANAENSVIGYDINPNVIETCNNLIDSNNYEGTTDPTRLATVDVVVIAVPTPLDSQRKPDLNAINAACLTIIEHIKKPVLVINESTSFPGTLRHEISEFIQSKSGMNHLYASAPERVDPGSLSWNQKNTPRIIAGLNPEATNLARKFYATFCENIVEVSSPEIAEAAKLFENTFRQVNIALVNEFEQICNALNIPTRQVLQAAATKPFGFMSFQPGPGVGGHCIPIDPSYLAYAAEKAGVEATFIRHANEVNLAMPRYVVSKVIKEYGDIKGKKIVVVGVAYKPNVSDTRESPAALVIGALKESSAQVSWHDPVVGTWLGEESSQLTGFDLAVVVTKHDAISETAIKLSAPFIFDCTGSLKGVVGI